MREFRLIRTPAASAAYNMSLDKRILERYLDDHLPVLRLYRWQSPSFTYGVSQLPEDGLDLTACLSDGVEVVKRMTGGGVLFHHDEITYSLVCDKRDIGEPPEVFVSYRQICGFLIAFYRSLGLEAGFALEAADFASHCVPHALCSASHEKYDIVIHGRKIGGNAQKRKRRVVFQHGSIPCSVDWGLVRRYLKEPPADMESGLTTLSAELGCLPDKGFLEEKLISAFAQSFGADFIHEDEHAFEAGLA